MKNTARLAALILVFAMLLPAAVYADSTYTGYSDITNHWSKKYVDYLAKHDIVTGTADNRFEPDRALTRGELAAMVAKAMKLDVNASVTSATYFQDVKAGDWYAGYANAAAAAGVIGGYEDGTFQANRSVTRAELAAIIIRALDVSSVSTNLAGSQDAALSGFADAGQLGWAKKAVAQIVNAKIMAGLDDKTFGPNEPATRAQASVVLIRMLSLILA